MKSLCETNLVNLLDRKERRKKEKEKTFATERRPWPWLRASGKDTLFVLSTECEDGQLELYIGRMLQIFKALRGPFVWMPTGNWLSSIFHSIRSEWSPDTKLIMAQTPGRFCVLCCCFFRFFFPPPLFFIYQVHRCEAFIRITCIHPLQ